MIPKIDTDVSRLSSDTGGWCGVTTCSAVPGRPDWPGLVTSSCDCDGGAGMGPGQCSVQTPTSGDKK